ncbi:MAG: DUF1778 domain-containing protein [Austwickia sp.]|nr:DUF1778 domain-containing protein [Actinomycetota bacterium]MCO5309002.1 DUF1778 domain-containing protein [Austwickia sp.]
MASRIAATQKTERINLRATQRQEALLRQAAEAADTSMSDFILSSAVVQAERVLADRRWFVATQEQYDEFVRLLDAPMETPKLAALFAEESPFGKPFPLE